MLKANSKSVMCLHKQDLAKYMHHYLCNTQSLGNHRHENAYGMQLRFKGHLKDGDMSEDMTDKHPTLQHS